MAHEQFIEKRFSASSEVVIDRANAIIAEYQAQGFSLTLRQLYYQFVARGLLPNKQQEYKRLGNIVSDARLAGLIDWEAIEDRTRNLESLPHWGSPESIIAACASQFRHDLWEDQPHRVEVWIEKEALVGVIERVCTEFDVPYFACRGYSSQSEQWRAGKRFQKYWAAGQQVVVLHLGDHDPSGIDMTRDNLDRLNLFAGGRGRVEVRRLALNMDQVEQYNPPPNPAKMTDSRAEGYVAEHGTESWELDALDPTVIDGLIRGQIEGLIEEGLWDEARERQERARDLLTKVSEQWDSLTAGL